MAEANFERLLERGTALAAVGAVGCWGKKGNKSTARVHPWGAIAPRLGGYSS